MIHDTLYRKFEDFESNYLKLEHLKKLKKIMKSISFLLVFSL